MRRPASLVFRSLLLSACLAGCAGVDDAHHGMPPAPLPGSGSGETAALRERLHGLIVTEAPVGGIAALELPSLRRHLLRPANAGLGPTMGLSEPDSDGALAFVSAASGWGKGYGVSVRAGEHEKQLFSGPGDPLWDHAISALALTRDGARLAYVVQPPDSDFRFKRLRQGPLRVWDVERAAARELGVNAAGERPAWLPDGRHLVYVAPAARAHQPCPCEQDETLVHMIDTVSGADTVLASGHGPIVSSDGASVLLMRGTRGDIVQLDLFTRAEHPVMRAHGLRTPIALIDSRYLIYSGAPAASAPHGTTANNSNFVGPKAMLAVKVMDLQTGQYATLIPLIDPRHSVTVRASMQP
ncbi:MAG: hypothetical protein V4582_06615 [Pseudomonadota bacterium]